MKELTKFQMYLYNIGGILLLIGAFMPVEASLLAYAPYVYLSGAVAFGGMQLMQRYEGCNIVIKRLRRQQIVASFLIILSGFVFLFFIYFGSHHRHLRLTVPHEVQNVWPYLSLFEGRKNSHRDFMSILDIIVIF
jgi:hypothetical protein